MRKKLLILLLVAVAIAGCATTEQPSAPTGQGGKGPGGEMRQCMVIEVSTFRRYGKSIKAGTLTEQEKEDILHTREEEKLARDVYLTLYNKWKLRIFQNIAKSEQTHMDAVIRLRPRKLESSRILSSRIYTTSSLQKV